jgi:Ca2+-binding RTX toxin-like protein
VALQIFAFSSVGAGVRVDLDGPDGEDAFIGGNVVIGSENGIAIRGTGAGHSVNVQGTIVGTSAAIQIGDSFLDFSQFLLIGESAYVATASTIDSAVIVRGDSSSVDNRGTIWSPFYGLAVGGDGAGNSLITNSGIIEATAFAVWRVGGALERITLNNTGEIRSSLYAYNGAAGGDLAVKDIITNSGLMVGAIVLDGGDDEYDGRLGRATNVVQGGNGNDLLRGGGSVDIFAGGAGADILHGGDGDDTVEGNEDGDSVAGGNGNDLVDGGSGADGLTGGDGHDTLIGGSGADAMAGGADNDSYEVENSGDVVSEAGGTGLDQVVSSITFNLSNAAKAVGAIEFLLLVGSADITGIGNALDNAIGGNAGDNLLNGVGGDDELYGDDGNDTIVGGADDDTLLGDNGNDALSGGAGNDGLIGGSGADTMAGGAGGDFYEVENAGDVVSEAGGSGTDSVQSAISFSLSSTKAIGAVENLTLVGSANTNGTGNTLANEITGNAGNNILDGFTGNDWLSAGAGSDTLRGGQGNDTLSGGAAKDVFVFSTGLNTATNRDTLPDFVHGLDKLHLENAVFAKLGAAGALKAANFRVGAAALDADDFIVYNKATGVLSYDINGNAAGATVQFAVLTNKPTLTTTDFLVI